MKPFINILLGVLLVVLVDVGQVRARTITVSDEDGLQAIATNVNNGITTYIGDTIILTQNITLTNEWTPIGINNSKPFKGTFEGQNHTISNFRVFNRDYAGLFGYADGGTISNITVYGEISTNNHKRIGGICGEIKNDAKIENCHFVGEINVTYSGSSTIDCYVGGIVGEVINGGTINRCSVTGLIYGNKDIVKCVGGIVGRAGPEDSNTSDESYPLTIITNCINLADVYGYSSVAGMVAYARLRVKVENCLNCGNINGFTPEKGNKYYGGIVGGYWKYVYMYNCLSTGTVFNTHPSAIIGIITQTQFEDECPKVNMFYDHQRMWKNHSRHGIAKNTNEVIDGTLLSNLEGWVCDGGYPYPKDFTYDSVIMVVKSYALFSNHEVWDSISCDFEVSNFPGTEWESKQHKVTINGSQVNIIGSGVDTLVVKYGSFYKNILIKVEKSEPLPITLTSFNAVCTGRSSYIYWTTATETNNEYFILEHSIDAINFQEVTRIPGAGASIEPNDYEYIDYNATGGDNYYRLIQVDYDGTRTPSEIIYANCMDDNLVHYEEPRAYIDNGIVLVAGDRMCDVYVYTILGAQRYTKRMYPGETGRLNYWGALYC